MTNAVATTTAGALSEAQKRHSALQAYATAQKVNLIRYASFNSQRGEMLTKDSDKAEIVIKAGTRFYLNATKIAHGFKCWKDGEVKDDAMFYLNDRPVLPAIETLNDHGPYEGERDGWKENMSFPLFHPEEKMGYIFQTSSLSANNAMKKFIGILVQAAMKDGKDIDAGDIPLIEYNKGSYKSKVARKEIFIPSFKVVGWARAEELNLTVTGLPPKADDGDQDPTGTATGGGTSADI